MDGLEVSVRVVELVSGVAVVAGIWFAGVQIRAQRRQEHRNFESLYVQRYWTIIDRLSADFRLNGKRTNLSESDRLALAQYLQLCEDEADLFELGRVTRETWGIWRSGIDSMLKQEVFLELLDSNPDSYPTLRRYMTDGRLAPRFHGRRANSRGL